MRLQSIETVLETQGCRSFRLLFEILNIYAIPIFIYNK